MDPYFDKIIDITPREPRALLTAGAAFWLGLAIVVAAYFVFATYQPTAALALVRGGVHVAGIVLTAVGSFLGVVLSFLWTVVKWAFIVLVVICILAALNG